MAQEPRRKGRPKSFYDKPAQGVIQSLDRALDVLDLLAAQPGLTLTEIANELAQSPATMHRVLGTLEARNFVEADRHNQTWWIGAMAFRLGSAFLRRSDLVERSRPMMRDLMEKTGETSNLGIEMNGNVMFVSQVETHETIRAFFPPGTQSPMHASGIGKALLSHFTPERLAGLFRDGRLEAFTRNTMTSPDGLKAELARTRARGWAFDNEEKTVGMRCVAAPIINMFGEVIAGISVSGPTQRMTETRIHSIAAQVQSAAQELSRSLGAPDGAT
ncbi:HTH-type transcriptional regulator BhcR [Roseovarius sp. M141]|uniref:HTH-type transcriptional regulator BhcR n=1 Tax=Roseovarius sp. M141 TaxID=2583806 RepID=UPI0020CF316A|nr:HTH-type transcriptional regulator BhcR [Roseovarius sp. M141]MCQ0093437.1 IclR family transcriptional regulator [Roseovarius sp. M141]